MKRKKSVTRGAVSVATTSDNYASPTKRQRRYQTIETNKLSDSPLPPPLLLVPCCVAGKPLQPGVFQRMNITIPLTPLRPLYLLSPLPQWVVGGGRLRQSGARTSIEY